MRTCMQQRMRWQLKKDMRKKYIRQTFLKDGLQYIFFQKKGSEFTLRFDPAPDVTQEVLEITKPFGVEHRPKGRVFFYIGNTEDVVYVCHSSTRIIKKMPAEYFFKQKHNNGLGVLTIGTAIEISHSMTHPESLSGTCEVRILPPILREENGVFVEVLQSDFVPAHS